MGITPDHTTLIYKRNFLFGGNDAILFPVTSYDNIKRLFDEINKANENDILFVAAAGNDGYSNDLYPHYPSSYATATMISVAATDNRDALAYFSNYGATTVHLGAPGVSVLSSTLNNSYSFLSGTSMAAPHVAGILLINDGKVNSKGSALNDPDGVSDPIAHK